MRSGAICLLFFAFLACSRTTDAVRVTPDSSPPSASVQIAERARSAAQGAGVDLDSVINRTMERASADLAVPMPDVDVTWGGPSVIPGIGVGGFADAYDGAITINIGIATGPKLREALTKQLPGTLAHEMHHSARIRRGPGYGTTLLEALVTEGLADHFAEELYPHPAGFPWDRALTRAQLAEQWARARSRLHDDGYDHERWFFGGAKTPRWTGYTIGYEITRRYLQRSGRTAAESVATQARRILKVSRFTVDS